MWLWHALFTNRGSIFPVVCLPRCDKIDEPDQCRLRLLFLLLCFGGKSLGTSRNPSRRLQMNRQRRRNIFLDDLHFVLIACRVLYIYPSRVSSDCKKCALWDLGGSVLTFQPYRHNRRSWRLEPEPGKKKSFVRWNLEVMKEDGENCECPCML